MRRCLRPLSTSDPYPPRHRFHTWTGSEIAHGTLDPLRRRRRHRSERWGRGRKQASLRSLHYTGGRRSMRRRSLGAFWRHYRYRSRRCGSRPTRAGLRWTWRPKAARRRSRAARQPKATGRCGWGRRGWGWGWGFQRAGRWGWAGARRRRRRRAQRIRRRERGGGGDGGGGLNGYDDDDDEATKEAEADGQEAGRKA